jgi:excisionase family DNA binding protein
VSGRIVLRLDRGLGWTKPLVVACCAVCGAELARHPNPDRAIRAAHRRRCPACATRSTARLPGTTSLAVDLALVRGQPAPLRRRWPPAVTPPLSPVLGGGETPMTESPRQWLTGSQAANRLQVSAKTVARWANQGRLQHRRTLGGHRRFDPELIDALVQALTYRP